MQWGKDPGLVGLGVKSCPLPVEKRMVIARCTKVFCWLAKKWHWQLANPLCWGKNVFLRWAHSQRFRSGSLISGIKTLAEVTWNCALEGWVFLIPHLILSTFHAGIRKIFLRLVLVNSPQLFFPPRFLALPLSSRVLSVACLFRKQRSLAKWWYSLLSDVPCQQHHMVWTRPWFGDVLKTTDSHRNGGLVEDSGEQ